jgi:hypothetical protein
MDAGEDLHRNGNGSTDPQIPSLPSAGGTEPVAATSQPSHGAAPPEAPASSSPAAKGEKPAEASDDARDPKSGRFMPGKSGNPKGRTPGIPNRNSEAVKLVNTRELSWCWKLAKAQAKKGDHRLLVFLLDKVLIDQSPAAAGITINANASAQANASAATAPVNLHDRFAELAADPAVADELAGLAARLAARGHHSVGAGKNGN